MSVEQRLSRDASQEQRAYFRVRANLPLRHESADASEVEAFVSALETGVPGHASARELTLIEQIDRIDRKLEMILSLLDSGRPRPLDESDQRPLEISGSGVRYPWPRAVEPGRLLKLQFHLPGSNPTNISCIGRVVSCREPDVPNRSYSLAVAFEHISEVDRDAIVRHTLEVERQVRRSQERDESDR